MKLAPEKCYFFQPKIKFLGHIVSSDGIETDPDKIEKVKNWPTPHNPDELRSFLAFAGYYRRFIKDFSRITRPLAELLPPTSERKTKKKPQVEWNWSEEHQKIFENLKEILTTAPILAFPDFTCPFELHTDASSKALGAVLCQTQDGKKRVIAYASRALSKSERNYSAFKLEFLALKWAITEKFSDYLVSNHFVVFTDRNPLTHVLTNAKLDATVQRWASALADYSFDIYYRAGINNADADAMSRYPYENTETTERTTLGDKAVKAICSIMTPVFIDILPSASLNITEILEEQGQVLAQKELFEIRKQQRQDGLIETWRRAVIDKALPKKLLKKHDLTMKRNFNNLFMKRGILFRKIIDGDREIEQLVLPETYKQEVLRGVHDDVGHPGIERTCSIIKERFYWPGMMADVERHVKRCDRCLRRKGKGSQRAPMMSVKSTYPLELVCMDYLTLEPAKGVGNVLVITDHFTKYALAVPTKNQTAKTTTDAFFNNFIVHYGIPTRIHTDQGANFESEIIKELCNLTNMRKSHTTPYHPQGNAGPERFNRTLLDMLGTLESSQKADWKKYVNSLVFAYNSTPHEATKISPYELMFGRRPKLPIDTVFENATQESAGNRNAQEYIVDLKQRMEKTRDLVQHHIDKTKSKQKKFYDRKAKPVRIKIGDKVLVRRVSFEGKHKIVDRFEDDIYTVEGQPMQDMSVFKVRSGDKCRTLHRNLLFLLEEQDEDTGMVDNVDVDVDQKMDASDDGRERDEKNSERKGDVTEEDSESDCEDGLVVLTDLSGDAHYPVTDRNSSERVESPVVDEVEDITDLEDKTVAGKDENDRATLCEKEKLHVGVESEVNPDVEIRLVDESGGMNDPVTDHVTHKQARKSDTGRLVTQLGTDVSENETDRTDTVERIREEARPSHRKKDDSNEEDKETVKDTDGAAAVPPIPVPRRSTRRRQMPKKFEDYYMGQIVPRPFDHKIQAAETIINSGILNEIDSDTARKILASIFN